MTAIAAVPKEASLEDKVRNQVEFYFSDANLPRDKFLRSKTGESGDGYVYLDIIASFKRLRSLTTDMSIIREALKNSNLVELNEDGTKLRRKSALPCSISNKRKTIYVKGFPQQKEPELESVVELFAPYGVVCSVRFRRYPDTKKFKGSAFIEFETEEAAQRAAEEEFLKDKSGSELAILSKDEYFKRKKQEQPSKANHSTEESKADSSENENKTSQPEESSFQQGLILGLENIGESVTREEIKQVFSSFGEISWVDFSRGQSTGYIRFAQPNSAKEAGMKKRTIGLKCGNFKRKKKKSL
ncbi:Lupus La protein [Galdieria sulphuraria]|nr:Lupus La protein [Galdieria sulphuraria]